MDHRGWLYNGKLYFFGGKDDSGVVVNTIEAFDPKDKTWSSFQTTNAPKLSAFALALNGDQVGGQIFFFISRSCTGVSLFKGCVRVGVLLELG